MSTKQKRLKMDKQEKTAAETIYEENRARDLDRRRSIKREKLTIEKLCEQEAAKLLSTHNAKFAFNKIDYDLRTVFIEECRDSVNRVTHAHVDTLRERLQDLNKRYTVGIITTRSPEKDEDIESSDDDSSIIIEEPAPPAQA